ncbi:NIL domain-containing protein [Sphaerochaeta globosa]|jgi:ferredoxin|uniref:NIL domain-containing protein n=1 Tax=Sphaerochaeta globosa (strain ATCC BAA-1886 / DSM 22777 / Buddy) TaxID=158189 RepID=F0RX29_SPHGB|nr:NIL domain-containing protein [Sphaerochaeta globosa]ADY11879.1 NIL domain-containing protein [Sphaerochaeta globosa str. Buddy]
MKRRYALRFSPTLVEQPIVSKLARAYDVDINILNADVASGRGGKLIVELCGTEQNLDLSVVYLSEVGVIVSEMVKELLFREEGCIHCGACTAVCSPRALSMNKEAKLVFDVALCVVCGLCTQACPLRLFEVSHEREA